MPRSSAPSRPRPRRWPRRPACARTRRWSTRVRLTPSSLPLLRGALAASASVRADEAVINQIRLNLEFATILAEADGRLGSLPSRVGNFVRQAENVALATITQVDPILVSFAVPERWLPEVKAAMARGTPMVRARAEGETAPPAEGQIGRAHV